MNSQQSRIETLYARAKTLSLALKKDCIDIYDIKSVTRDPIEQDYLKQFASQNNEYGGTSFPDSNCRFDSMKKFTERLTVENLLELTKNFARENNPDSICPKDIPFEVHCVAIHGCQCIRSENNRAALSVEEWNNLYKDVSSLFMNGPDFEVTKRSQLLDGLTPERVQGTLSNTAKNEDYSTLNTNLLQQHQQNQMTPVSARVPVGSIISTAAAGTTATAGIMRGAQQILMKNNERGEDADNNKIGNQQQQPVITTQSKIRAEVDAYSRKLFAQFSEHMRDDNEGVDKEEEREKILRTFSELTKGIIKVAEGSIAAGGIANERAEQDALLLAAHVTLSMSAAEFTALADELLETINDDELASVSLNDRAMRVINSKINVRVMKILSYAEAIVSEIEIGTFKKLGLEQKKITFDQISTLITKVASVVITQEINTIGDNCAVARAGLTKLNEKNSTKLQTVLIDQKNGALFKTEEPKKRFAVEFSVENKEKLNSLRLKISTLLGVK